MSLIDLKIYTPNHNPITDTLIMWGVVSLIHHKNLCDPYSSKVIGSGGRYTLVLRNCKTSKEIINSIIEDLIDVNSLSKLISEGAKKKKYGAVTKDERLLNALDGDSKSGIAAAFYKIYQEGLDLSIYTVDHKMRLGEGRGGVGTTLFIPFSGIYGKYLTQEFKYHDRSYTVCETCLALSAIGFRYAISVVKVGAERSYTVLGFDGEIEISELGAVLRDLWYKGGEELLESALKRKANLTHLAKAFIYAIKTPDSFPKELNWYIYTFSYELGGAKRVTGYKTFNLSQILDFFYKVSNDYPKFVDLVEKLLNKKAIDNGGDEVINKLAELSYTRDIYKIYQVLRKIRAVIGQLGRDEKKLEKAIYSNLSVDLVKGLIKTI